MHSYCPDVLAATAVDQVLEAARIVVWPVTLVLVLLLFRGQLAERLGRFGRRSFPAELASSSTPSRRR